MHYSCMFNVKVYFSGNNLHLTPTGKTQKLPYAYVNASEGVLV